MTAAFGFHCQLSATFPFFARQVQVVLADLDRGVIIEAAQASGATLWDTIKVYLGEGLLSCPCINRNSDFPCR